MKKIFSALLALGLMGTAMLYVSSCAKLSGPLSPNADILGNTVSLRTFLPYLDDGDLPATVSQTAKAYFNMPMNPATLNTSTVRIYTLDDSGTSETPYTAFSLSYRADSRTLVCVPTGGWADNKYYHLVMTTGIQSINGKSLDGNGNNLAEDDAFDAIHMYFTLGTPTTALPGYLPMTPVRISSISWATNTNSGNVWNGGTMGEIGAIDNTYSYITITAVFAVTGASLDPAFSLNAGSISSGLRLTDANGSAVSPMAVNVTTTPTGFVNDQVEIVLDLPVNSKVQLKLLGGLTGIRSATDATLRLSRGFYLDGNANNRAERSDDTKTAILRTTSGAAQCVTLVSVQSLQETAGYRRIPIVFNVPTGVGTLDPATITPANFKLFNASVSPEKPIAPASVELDNSTYPNPVVYVYIPMKFMSANYNLSQSLRVVVTKNVRASDGTGFDANGDNIAGSDIDNYISSTFTVTSYYTAPI